MPTAKRAGRRTTKAPKTNKKTTRPARKPTTRPATPAKKGKKAPARTKAPAKPTKRPAKKPTTRRATPAKKGTKAPARTKAPAKTTKRPAKNARNARRAPATKKAPAKRRAAKQTARQTAPAPPAPTNVQPMLSVPDVDAEVRWLEAFGFQTTMTMPGPGGMTMHAVLNLGDAVVHVDPLEVPGWPSDERMTANQTGPRGLGISLYVLVPDVVAAHAAFQSTSSPIHQPPTDQFWGDRTVMGYDPAGYLWCFAQHIRDVTPDQMGEAMKQMAAQQ